MLAYCRRSGFSREPVEFAKRSRLKPLLQKISNITVVETVDAINELRNTYSIDRKNELTQTIGVYLRSSVDYLFVCLSSRQ